MRLEKRNGLLPSQKLMRYWCTSWEIPNEMEIPADLHNCSRRKARLRYLHVSLDRSETYFERFLERCTYWDARPRSAPKKESCFLVSVIGCFIKPWEDAKGRSAWPQKSRSYNRAFFFSHSYIAYLYGSAILLGERTCKIIAISQYHVRC